VEIRRPTFDSVRITNTGDNLSGPEWLPLFPGYYFLMMTNVLRLLSGNHYFYEGQLGDFGRRENCGAALKTFSPSCRELYSGHDGLQPRHRCEGGKTAGCRCMTNRIRILKHETVPDCGSFEVRFPDGRPSRYFYFDDLPSRRLGQRGFTLLSRSTGVVVGTSFGRPRSSIR
jgi:hypothetical protein